GDVLGRAVDGFAVEIGDANAVEGEDSHIAILEEKHFAGVLEQRRYVAGDKIFAIAEADDRRWADARGDEFLRILGGKKDQRVDAAQIFERFTNGFFEGQGLGV